MTTSDQWSPKARAGSRDGLGNIVLLQSRMLFVLTAGAVCAALCLIGFLVFGTYTARRTLSGQLMPTKAVIEVRSPLRGTIIERRVTEGQTLRKGDVLYIVSGERVSDALGATEALIGDRLRSRLDRMHVQIEKLRELSVSELDSMRTRRTALSEERSSVLSILENQRRRLELADRQLTKYGAMRQGNFVSDEQYSLKEQEVLGQRGDLELLRRELKDIDARRSEAANDEKAIPLKYDLQIAEVERAIASTEQELAQNEASRETMVTAPQGGTAGGVVAALGDTVDGSTALMSILPEGVQLEAHFLAPSAAIGFARVGDPVLIRYDAYPYQKFGHYPGKVLEISRTPLTGSARATRNLEVGRNSSAEPMFRIVVGLNSQTVDIRGRSEMLQVGMTVQGDLLLEQRQLYEWILEPFFGVSRRL